MWKLRIEGTWGFFDENFVEIASLFTYWILTWISYEKCLKAIWTNFLKHSFGAQLVTSELWCLWLTFCSCRILLMIQNTHSTLNEFSCLPWSPSLLSAQFILGVVNIKVVVQSYFLPWDIRVFCSMFINNAQPLKILQLYKRMHFSRSYRLRDVLISRFTWSTAQRLWEGGTSILFSDQLTVFLSHSQKKFLIYIYIFLIL